MKNNGVKNEHKINTCRRTDQLWLFPSLHFMIFVMPAMFGSIFLMSGYIAVMFLEQIGTAIICTALMFRHLFAMSGRREAVIIGVFHRLPSVLSMPFPRFGAVIAEPPFFFCITSFHRLMIRLLYTGRLLLFGKRSSFPGQQMPLIGTERVGNPAFAVVLPPQLCCPRRKRLRWKL